MSGAIWLAGSNRITGLAAEVQPPVESGGADRTCQRYHEFLYIPSDNYARVHRERFLGPLEMCPSSLVPRVCRSDGDRTLSLSARGRDVSLTFRPAIPAAGTGKGVN